MARKKYVEEEEEENQSAERHCHQDNLVGIKSQNQLQNNNNSNHGINTKNKNPQFSSSIANKQQTHLHHNNKKSEKNNVTLNFETPSKNFEESFYAVIKQLSVSGLTIREMPGDGNCLFRALADQLEGHPRNHLDHRRAVVQYMKENRPDFEPFVAEDDEPFEKYVQTLSQPGTFAGNDAIVAFSRLHNVTIVIHQLNSPPWLIHPSAKDENHSSSSGREIHIAYHNGDHYNSVRKLGDESDDPANIKYNNSGQGGQSEYTKSTINMTGKNTSPHHPTPSTHHNAKPTKINPPIKDHNNSLQQPSTLYNDDDHTLYGNLRDEDFWVKDNSDIDRLVKDIIQKTGYNDTTFIRETLMDFNFDMISTVDHIVRMNFFFCQQSHQEDIQEDTTDLGSVVGVNQININNMESQCIELGSGGGLSESVNNTNFNDENDDGNGYQEHSIGNYDASLNEENFHVMKPVNLEYQEETHGLEFVYLKTGGPRPTNNVETSQDQENLIKGNIKKMSNRQKKELKKKERKRESDQRKKKENETTLSSDPVRFISSNIGGSLTI